MIFSCSAGTISRKQRSYSASSSPCSWHLASRSTPPGDSQQTATTHLEAIAQCLETHGYSSLAIAQVISQERKRTIDESRWNKFANWCRDQGIDPFTPNQVEVTNFLVSFQQELKSHTAGRPDKLTRFRLLLLLRIQLLKRCSDCAYIVTRTIDLTELSFRQARRKNQKENPHMTEPISFERNDEVPELCLKRAFKGIPSNFGKAPLCSRRWTSVHLSFQQDEIKSETMAKIRFRTMEEVDVDTKIYKSHSIRLASANAFLDNGMPGEKVTKLGDWTFTKVFEKFYLRPKATGAAKCLTDLDSQVRRKEGRTRGGRSTQRK